MTVVRYAELPAGRLFNFCSPLWLPEVMRSWPSPPSYFAEAVRPLRELVERTYVEEFNRHTGHYRKLEESVEREGFRNPILVAAGKLDRRWPSEVPPWERRPDLIACEWVGGSRLWVAQRLGLTIPCVVNDHTGVLPDAEPLSSPDEVAAKFADPPRTLKYRMDAGVYLNNVPYTHLPEKERYDVRHQSVIRRRVLGVVREVVRSWRHERQ